MSLSDGPDSGDPLSEHQAEDLLRCICFKTGPPGTVGVELEWFVHDAHAPRLPVPVDRLRTVFAGLGSLPLKSALTFEPGGQLELSSPPASSLAECVAVTAADLDVVRDALRADGLVLTGGGTDPWQGPRERLLREPRYDAMETWLDRTGPAGRAMMRDSASVQVCLDAGYEEPGPLGLERRWRLAHLLGPVLVAVFAASPVLQGRPATHRSARQSLWAELDPVRSLAPRLDREPRGAWADHVLDAPVMCVRRPDGPWLVPDGLTFRDWLRHGRPRPATRADLDYHISTLFPPVRPRGHLELRMLDAQPGEDGWLVPLAVVSALFDDPEAAEAAYRLAESLTEGFGPPGPQPPPRDRLWTAAARDGLAVPALREAAVSCFGLARAALARGGAPTAVQDAVAAFEERFVLRGRCPADELLPPTAGARPGTGHAASGRGSAPGRTVVSGKDAPA
ncbi:ergothioneine biosynthesis glutamate--cysteine ligase EgtA [Streptomyces sp. LP05-1]|uniref:Glutamate--cysteine ligase EgtA n=1 Tax=Streptomyces pyxinae TaxID=2970734 RepID=A0ABT2CC52_9ACTN|nr:ergothioneine biosynthesis glutamate--cysteine ligase EgtA [Streptomyces sp. LP05-1]MCS0634697.1 ergothioneine biosynthesis glutamate--cysteine ligase EgtA [Streptomyces sp. LP05-1]